MKAIKLTKGKTALVSNRDYWLVRSLKRQFEEDIPNGFVGPVSEEL
jgi:hypothetical protein